MDGSEIVYVSLFALFCLGIVMTTRQLFWGRLRRTCLRQDLFHAKDSLLMLVAKRNLPKDDFVFQSLLAMVNVFIEHTHKITLKQISKIALTEQEKLEAEKFTKRFVTEIEAKDQPTATELKSLTIDLFCTFRDLVLDSSFLLRFFVTSARFWRRAYRYLRPLIDAVMKFPQMGAQKEGYKAYRGFDQYIVQLRAAC
jgi:hypothetical protein